MEMERALLEGEHHNEMERLQEDQEKILQLRHKQNILMEKASRQREKVGPGLMLNTLWYWSKSSLSVWDLIGV